MLFASIPDPRILSLLADSSHLQSIIEHTWEHMMIFDANRELVHQSTSGNRNFVFSEANVESFISLIDPEYRMEFMSHLKHARGSKEFSTLDYMLNLDASQPVWVQSTFCFVPGTEEPDSFVFVFSKEISQLKKYEAYLKSMAFNDPLTNLPNRRSLVQHYQQTASFSKRYNLQFGIIYVDVDDFKSINDTYGHSAGDQFLKHVAVMVNQCLRESDILARIGGDEFVALLHNLPTISVIDTVIHRIYGKMADGMQVDGKSIKISLSIGAAIYPIHGETLESLLQNADTALYTAKKKSKNTYAIFA